ncbi:MAG: hypothetical protein A2Y10_20060 [Planctomycetes bacterium GWF2_41_51]|nr:MAG: hypothetical protein A2Y10_20060 [Planctomycetes bacterium GWF2_41_51]HBG26351.1 hypothetical protein [Phycisphaerales bacterium]
MKTGVGFLIVSLAFLPLCTNATPIAIDIYNDTTISSGEYGRVNIYDTPPDQTTVSLLGGIAESVWTYDSSSFNMQDGNVSWVISAQNTSNITISGGSVGSLQLIGHSIAYIFGGNISGSLGIMENTAIAHIYATNFNVAPKNGNPMNGWLITGNWDDATNSPFTIWSRNNTLPMPGTAGSQVVLHIVPEPVTLSFLLLGLMGLGKFRG